MILPMQCFGLLGINLKNAFPQVVVEILKRLHWLMLEADEKRFTKLGAVSKIEVDFHELGA
jgi:beta-xylosidase